MFVVQADLLALINNKPALAAEIIQTEKSFQDTKSSQTVDRGEGVSTIMKSFDLAKKQGSFIDNCLHHLEDCFFVFSTRSDYDQIQFKPLILYPDVFPAYRYYAEINLASMLGLVHGYLEENSSPFYPGEPMTKIQALKVLLGAANLIQWKDRFELSGPDLAHDDLTFKDSELDLPENWWYARYLRVALDYGIITGNKVYSPNQPVDKAELEDMIDKTRGYLRQAQSANNLEKNDDSENTAPANQGK